MTASSTSQDFRIGLRILMAALVAILSYIGWLAMWALGVGTLSLAYLFDPRARGSALDAPVYRFGEVWQWVVALLASILIAAVLIGSRRGRSVAVAWFMSLVVLAALDGIAEGLNGSSLIILLLAAALVAGILRSVPRAA
jgi:hypothetical protein